MALTESENIIDELRTRCDDILDGYGGQAEIDALMLEVEGGYSFPLRATNSSHITADRTLDGVRKLRGWLGFHLQNMAFNANRTNITTNATANASANATVTVSQTISQVWELPDSVLTNDEKIELTKLLNDLDKVSNDDPSKVKKAAKAVGDWLFDKAIEAVPAVMPFVMQAIQSIGG
ncbi:hypothetical protein [Gordonibacter urolithinfaciens]|uniref:hypothetical protein n=1 Tax=Gordonibacter urolithinfaciens TaxID=1335613 RepID=UPI001D079F0A|nr:hypothetical protein [Gordonibacter urolithinfaciens]MCB7085755.1 hypothetical protein [Gordonibacter urolithinfaciens]